MSSARGSGSGGGGGPRTRVSASSRRSKSPDMIAGEQPGLRRLVQKRLLDDVFEAASVTFPGWKVLIVDDHSMRVVSSAVGMYDIMERKVTLVESLEKKRAPFPDMGAIYLLNPTAASITKLLEDFSTANPLYGNGVFLYFLGRLPDRLLDQIKTCKPLMKRLKALSEINVDFLAKEERAFTLDMRDAFSSFYLRKGTTPVELSIAEKLVTVCATLNEYPHIRYKQSSAIATSLANVFHLKMDEFVSQNPGWWYHGGPQKKNAAQRERGTLLLLDRADDCLTPLMHDFHYQPMVHDLLPMDGDRITYQSETATDTSRTEAKDVLLDERDPLWVELRGKHIAQVIETLSERIREIMNSQTGSTLGKKNGGGGNMSLSQMAAALKSLPEYKEVMSKLSQHMHISHECMDSFKKDGLLDLSDLEQTLATGKDEDGRSPKLADMIDRVEGYLMRIKNTKARLRLILIVTIAQGGLRSQDRRRLMNAAELTRADSQTLNALEILGLSTTASSEKNHLLSMLTGGRLSSGGASDDEAEYAASRYIPAIKTILEDLATNELSMEDYPSIMPMPDMGPSQGGSAGGGRRGAAGNPARQSRGQAASARKAGGPSNRWSKSSSRQSASSSGPKSFNGGRAIVFMMGGLSYSEMRAAGQVMTKESREIVIGSTAFVSAKEFVEDLATLSEGSD